MKVLCYHGNKSTILLFIQFLERLLKFPTNFTLLKYVKSQRSCGFLITKKLIFGFQILDLKAHFSASLNADKTPNSYVSVGKMTMAKRGEKSVPIKGLTDKRNITLTFAVTFTGDFLPMQIIYGSKTDRSQPRGVVFPKGFYVTQNEKHWSNRQLYPTSH